MSNHYEDEKEATGLVGLVRKFWYGLRLKVLFLRGKVRAWKRSREK